MRRRYGRRKVIPYIIFGLIVIGILSSLMRSFSQWIIPVLVFGLVFLLYKFPPSRWRYYADRFRSNGMSGLWGKNGGKKSKRAKFRVIRGGNKPDDDNIPKYH